MTGLPQIVALSALASALIVGNIASLASDLEIRRQSTVADSNLEQAERILKACFKHGYFPIDDRIYKCRAEKTELTLRHVPELSDFYKVN